MTRVLNADGMNAAATVPAAPIDDFAPEMRPGTTGLPVDSRLLEAIGCSPCPPGEEVVFRYAMIFRCCAFRERFPRPGSGGRGRP